MGSRYRLVIFKVVFITYLVSYNYYLWINSTVELPKSVLKIANYNCIACLLMALYIVYRSKLEEILESLFYDLAYLVLIITFLVIELVQYYKISNPYEVLTIFNSGVVLLCFIFLIVFKWQRTT